MVKTLLVLLLVFVIAGAVAWAGDVKKVDKPVVKGVIVAIDKTADTFTVRDDAGKDHVFMLSGKWMHNVKEGEMVAVHFKAEGDKKVVTNIVPSGRKRIVEPKVASPAPSPAETPKEAPKTK